MMAQVAEYAPGEARDPFLQTGAQARREPDRRRARVPAAPFLLLRPAAHDPPLSALRRAVTTPGRRRRTPARAALFGAQDFRDLQMWSQLAWFDEEFQEHDPEVREWIAQRPQFHARRPAPHGRKAARDRRPGDCRNTANWPASGQIEISTTPYLPSHSAAALRFRYRRACRIPDVPLPPRFRYPEDARRQLAMARDYIAQHVRRGAGGAVAVGRFGFRRSLRHRRRARLRLGRHRQRRARPHPGPRRSASDGTLPAVPLAAGRAARWA